MGTLVVNPARLGAMRLPRKPLRLLSGLPLVVRVWQRISQMKVADAVVVATEDESVASAAREAGADCVMTSDKHNSGTERFAVRPTSFRRVAFRSARQRRVPAERYWIRRAS